MATGSRRRWSLNLTRWWADTEPGRPSTLRMIAAEMVDLPTPAEPATTRQRGAAAVPSVSQSNTTRKSHCVPSLRRSS